jgi:hypothetical protein
MLKGSSELHEQYKHDALLILGSRDDTVALPNEVGVGHPLSEQYKRVEYREVVRYGIPGTADIWGFTFVICLPVHFSVEVKSGKATLQKNQKAWRKKVLEHNGIHIVYRGDKDKLKRDFENERNRCRDLICKYGALHISSTGDQ